MPDDEPTREQLSRALILTLRPFLEAWTPDLERHADAAGVPDLLGPRVDAGIAGLLREEFPDASEAALETARAAARALEQAALREAVREQGAPEHLHELPWQPARDHPRFTAAEHELALTDMRFALR